MYKATTNGRKCVLKAFVVNRAVPASALERQLSVLARLRHPNVLRPRAVVCRNQPPDVATMLELPAWRYDLRRWLRVETPSLQQKQNVARQVSRVAGGSAVAGLSHVSHSAPCARPRQVLAGLAYLHDHNIVHCDLKPEVVLMSRDNVPMLSEYDVGLGEAASSGAATAAPDGSVDPSSIKVCHATSLGLCLRSHPTHRLMCGMRRAHRVTERLRWRLALRRLRRLTCTRLVCC